VSHQWAPPHTVRYYNGGGSFYLDTTQRGTGTPHQQLLDSGADREMVGRKYAIKHRWPTKKLQQQVQLQFMDGSYGEPITRAAWIRIRIPATNGAKNFTIKYLIADIPEGPVLGLNWLKTMDPDIRWARNTVTWRTPLALNKNKKGIIAARKTQRKRIIQSEIRTNEAPDWVKERYATTLVPRTKGLPPHRGLLDYRIKLKQGYTARRDKQRSFSPEERRMFAELADEEARIGRWRVSDSAQAVQMLWVVKAGGKKRPCQDYRPLNRWIEDDAFPLPIIRDMITDIVGNKHLTSLDLPRAYNEVRIADKTTEDLLAFYCNGTLYAPTVMQFGSKTAVSHFQRFITYVLGPLIGRGVHAYLDNIVIYANDQDTHDYLLDQVLKRLEQSHLSIQPAKCEWNKEEIQFCGFLIGRPGIRLDPEKIQAVLDWEPPTPGAVPLKTQLREYLGFCNFYKEAVDDYSDIAAPLTDLTSETKPWKWGDPEATAFQLLKMAVVTSPIRAAYEEGVPIEAHTDASDTGVAGTLEHRYDCGHTQPIGFFSAKLNKAERNYHTTDKELLAIVKTLRHFRSWLVAAPEPIKIWSDHKALQHFLTTTKMTPRHARWGEELADFRFVIQHIPGRANRAADGLSRRYREVEPAEMVRPLRAENFSQPHE